jgi:ABC-type multidrug transport system fused ATPase/permease subunit
VSKTELLDEYTTTDKQVVPLAVSDRGLIGFTSSSFTWSLNEVAGGTQTPSTRGFVLKIDGELLFKRGVVSLIVGPTGCGKTSILMALLGEMHYVPSGPESWFNLPRGGGVAYAAQESWVQSETIKVFSFVE